MITIFFSQCRTGKVGPKKYLDEEWPVTAEVGERKRVQCTCSCHLTGPSPRVTASTRPTHGRHAPSNPPTHTFSQISTPLSLSLTSPTTPFPQTLTSSSPFTLMASCDDDDDFSLLRDDNHHHLQPYAPHHHHHHFSTASVQTKPVADDDAEDYGNPFDDDAGSEKRKEHEEIGDGTSPSPYGFNKRPKAVSSVSGGGGGVGGVGGGEYRKDREEWSDTAIVCLLEAYTDKFTQLNRGNLRGRDWEEVAAVVSERCENQTKSVEQCKNKVDNLKKRYKLERHRMNNGCISTSHWPWFKQMEHIVGNSLPSKFAEEDKAIVPATNSPRQSKRLFSPH